MKLRNKIRCAGCLGLAWLLWTGPPLQARINVVTLPGRDSVQLTIYNSVDLTLVKETRVLTLRQGLNRLEFSWANTLIDPTSVEFRAVTHADEVEVLDVSYPPRVTNTLEWRIKSEFAGEATVEIRYFTSGISWSADYLAEAGPSENTMALTGYVKVNNQSGEGYENAQVRMIVGVIRLVEDIAALAREKDTKMPGKPIGAVDQRLGGRLNAAFELGKAKAEAKPREIVKEGLSEYFMYTVEGRDTIPTGWSKRLPSFKADAVPMTSYFKYERERWGDQAIRYYRFKNDAASKLGQEPLPDGSVNVFRTVNEDKRYAFVGRTAVKYIPVNEAVEWELGLDHEVLVKPTLMNWEKTDLQFDKNGNLKGWTVKETWNIETQNSKPMAVIVDLRRNFNGDWALRTTTPYEKVDANKVKFMRTLAPHEKQSFAYEVVTRYGSNETR